LGASAKPALFARGVSALEVFGFGLFSILAFLLAFGVLVTFHEFGHFIVARAFGIRVLSFRIGFGKALWRYQAHPEATEYRLGVLPLGGAVEMLDTRSGEVPPYLAHQAFDQQAPWKKILVTAAGPAANFFLAVLLYWLIFSIGMPGQAPLLAEPSPQTPAAVAGLRAEDKVLTVNDKSTPTWASARLAILSAAVKGQPLTVIVEKQGQLREVQLPTSAEFLKGRDQDPLAELGLAAFQPPGLPLIMRLADQNGAAAKAGLQAGDLIVSSNGQTPATAQAFIQDIKNNPNKTIALQVERAGVLLPLSLTPVAVSTESGLEGRIGAQISQKIKDYDKEKLQAVERYPLLTALGQGVLKTIAMSGLTLEVLARMVSGQASLSNISGPITIAYYAGRTAELGFLTFLAFLAVISISIGLINLLPIPMLDGGHIVLYSLEWLRGRALPLQAEIWLWKIGLLSIIALAFLALYNDFQRFL
jgi:regulator of sigma E protease